MELREYFAVRRAYNLARQEMPAGRRLTFVELSILCRLDAVGRAMNTSEIAEYQGALRPTMTHRTKHLAELGLINRAMGNSDRRNVTCQITEDGRGFVLQACEAMCAVLRAGTVLSRTTPLRLRLYVSAMGELSFMSGDLVLLAILQSPDGGCSISELVGALGLLQPTVSMSVASLVEAGLVSRARQDESGSRSGLIRATESGTERAKDLSRLVGALVVRRKP